MAIWSLLGQQSAQTIVLIAIFAVACLIWVRNGLYWLLLRSERRKSAAGAEGEGPLRIEPFRRLIEAARLDAETLLGVWHVSLGGDYTANWEFRENGSVFSTRGSPHGIWSLEDAAVRIRWDAEHWETFRRPLNPAGSGGESWSKKPVAATKLGS